MSPVTKTALAFAGKMRVACGGCGMYATPLKVLGVVERPQHPGVSAYAIVAFACSTADCGEPIPCEVDLNV